MGLESLIASTAWGAVLVKGPLGKLTHFGLELLTNWLANNGLMVLNIGAIYVNGEIDQKNFDKAMEDGLSKIEQGGLSDAQKKAIDDEVIKAARRFLKYNP